MTNEQNLSTPQGIIAKRAENLLPDVDGLVHGIVQLEPYVRIQCDGCGYIHDGEPGKTAFAILTCGIRFNARRYRSATDRDTRRLCRDCQKAEWSQ